MSPSPPRARESGQAAVEAALIVPMVVFLLLGIIQVTMMQQARLLTEYAAYRAVRAGIVNSGSCKLMHDSALIALLPTLGPVNGLPGRTDTIKAAENLRDEYVGRPAWLSPPWAPLQSKYFWFVPVLRVKVLNPKGSELEGLFKTYGVYSASARKSHPQEIDFDDVRDRRVIAANLLTVQVTYFYEMRIPFANQFIHGWFLGMQYLDDLRGVQFDNQQAPGGMSESRYLQTRGMMRGGDIARIAQLAAERRIYVVPLVANYTMRMQSNLMQNQVSACAK